LEISHGLLLQALLQAGNHVLFLLEQGLEVRAFGLRGLELGFEGKDVGVGGRLLVGVFCLAPAAAAAAAACAASIHAIAGLERRDLVNQSLDLATELYVLHVQILVELVLHAPYLR